jgi:hypothetical protein
MVTNNAANIPTGVSGTILQGAGVGVAPTFSTATYPSTATGTGKIIRANGTNWVASTATYPDTAGTVGNVATSDGTNFNSSAFSGSDGITVVSTTLTSAQVKALVATPIQLLAAPGAGKVHKILSTTSKLNYGGTNVFVCTFSQGIGLSYGAGTTPIGGGIGPAQLTPASNQSIAALTPLMTSSTVYTACSNQAVYFYNTIGIEISGNAANDNTVQISVAYQTITI